MLRVNNNKNILSSTYVTGETKELMYNFLNKKHIIAIFKVKLLKFTYCGR